MNKVQNNSFPLFESVRTVITETQQYVVRNVNSAMTLAYFRIGKMIVEDEQNGNERAGYAQEILKKLSISLNNEFGKGYSVDNLQLMRKFYLTYEKYESVIRISDNPISESLIRKFESPFKLSWTHYIQLLKIKSDDERSFYEIEAVNNNWSVRELQRQYGSSLFERLALSTDKEGVRQLAAKGQILEKPLDAVKSHYVLEFLELQEDSRYSESDMETAIINKLESFMMELGKGFLFEGRQRRITTTGK